AEGRDAARINYFELASVEIETTLCEPVGGRRAALRAMPGLSRQRIEVGNLEGVGVRGRLIVRLPLRIPCGQDFAQRAVCGVDDRVVGVRLFNAPRVVDDAAEGAVRQIITDRAAQDVVVM